MRAMLKHRARYGHALAPSRSKVEITLEFFRSIPRYYDYAIIVTVAAFAATIIAYFMKLIDSNTSVSLAIGTVAALAIELGASLREELAHEQVEELD